jgi:hypothetical protein
MSMFKALLINNNTSIDFYNWKPIQNNCIKHI